MKGILRQFSVARTPQQKEVAERRNTTLIEAARNMLANYKLPTTFWAEAVNTACYVKNRVLIVKPYNKTPYELFHGRTPTLSFMRPFRCPVTILNTIDHLGKFDGKANEGSGPDCLFDIDALKRTMNHELIVTGTNSNSFADTKASDNSGQARKEIEPIKDYIFLPLWTADPSFSQDPKSSHNDGFKPSSDDGKKVDEDLSTECEFNADGGIISSEFPFDPNMPALEDVNIFNFSNDDKDDDVVADMNNFDTTIQDLKIQTFLIKYTRLKKQYIDYIKLLELEVKTASTPMETQKSLLKDESSEEMDVHMYRSMIGSLMYLTSLRPDIMFAMCTCARYQVNPKVSHLYVVKRIFRYLKGQPKIGLWYPKDSSFYLVAYTDSDYARASLDRKSTTRGFQFLGCRLISWQCKKQIVIANSTIEAEYVAALSCRGQVLWIQNQLLDYGYNFRHTKIFIDNNRKGKKSVRLMKKKLFGNGIGVNTVRHNLLLLPSDPIEHAADEAVHKELGDSLVRAATTSSSLGAEQDIGGGPRCQETIGDTTAQTRRVKKLEKGNGSRTHKLKRLYKVGLTARVESSDDEESLGEDASKQGRIEVIDKDEDITLVNDQDDPDKDMFDVNVLGGEEVFAAAGQNKNVVSITTKELTLAQALEALKTSKPKVKGHVIQDPEEHVKLKKKDQIRLDEEAAKRLQSEFDEEARLNIVGERKRKESMRRADTREYKEAKEKKYPLTLPPLSMMLEKKLQIDYESEMAYQLCKLIKKQLKK
uniref:Uncharacterized mitochondrial protein AtMg00810-like n=1 Tax=Tanacetum cinerariifolium TaxID=118510 RepID=A0A6L2NY76_TANCI|nr:uncharacterized mitochondrial protein AtMg00810-like [Tanacetum cinerariifolium]